MFSVSDRHGMFTKSAWRIMITVFVIFMVSGCGGGGGSSSDDGEKTTPPAQNTSSLTLGQEVAVTTESVSTAGGSVTVNDAQSPLNGFSITVPAGAYPTSTDFKIFYQPVTGHDMGANFNPITPLIEVENGDDLADEIMTVTIPVEIPAGNFAMAFFYDKNSGTFEGMPFLSHDEKSVTVATRHFSDFVVTSISEDVLFSQMPIESGFKPGKDDWQFANMGSWLASGGHCAGQSIAAVWYYTEKYLNGAPALFGAYDNNGNTKTGSIWQDDSYGYRFCSVIQHDIDWELLGKKIDETFQQLDEETQKFNQNQVWMAFAYSILITGEPQLLGLYTDYDEYGERGGHEMVIYGVKETEDDFLLQVADPNYPGQARSISFDIYGNPSPYSSAANAADAANGYGSWFTDFYYDGKGAMIPWSQVADRWAQVEEGTIGNGLFPDCQIYASVLEASGWEEVKIEDGVLDTTDPGPEIFVKIPNEDGSFSSPDKLIFTAMDNPSSQFVSYDDMYTARLEEGENLYGVNSTIKKQSDGYVYYDYMDFQWITINYTPQPGYQLIGSEIKDYIELGEWAPPPFQYNARVTAPNMENITDEILLGTESLDFEVMVSKLPFTITIEQDVSGIWDTHSYSTPNGDQHYWTQTSETYRVELTKSDGVTKQRSSNSDGRFTIGIDASYLQEIAHGYYLFTAFFSMDYKYRTDTYGGDEYEFHGSSQQEGLPLLYLYVYVTIP